ncbi:MAG: GNAT family N-acetyltransferase [Candidatus Pseudobacter hemicellulosilyticus]|uniref:GNAT family N-acetyltransferase n=1 Tax=Candidatus Pseudobacter hemicellulosilyticus TaxID=3121375 RepID=A0AAJ6BHY4_9BACT|nr:MAG: GNAT family N-acetyltransferase [Pseudobacter sp.]
MSPLPTIRNASPEDLAAIVAIYNSTVAGRMVTADLEPVTPESRLPWFHAHNPEKRPLWVVEDTEEDIIAWMSFQDFYGRAAYNGTAEISIYIDPASRGKGLGKQLLRYCMEQAPALGVHTLLGYIFAHNEPSIRLFEQLGFEEWAHLPRIALLDGVERGLKILGKRLY